MLSTPHQSRHIDDERLDRLFRALGDRTRRSILNRLARGPARISDLAAPFDMSLPAVSKHLRVLERAGLVQRQIDGREHRCSLSAEPLRDADSWVLQYRQFWDESVTALAEHLRNFND